MAKNSELDRLRMEQEEAFRHKQDVYQKYQAAKQRADQAYQNQQAAWNERVHARDKMNREYEALQAARAHNDAIWSEYKRIRDNNNSRIDSLKPEADSLYQKMSRAFDSASYAYNYGSKADAAIYSSEGKQYKERLAYINAEIRKLGQEVKDARNHAERYSAQGSSSKYNSAKEAFQKAKAVHESTQATFNAAKAERERLKIEFQSLHAEHLKKKNAFQTALEYQKRMRESKKNDDESLMMRAGVPFMYRQDCKVVKEPDGTVNFYFGGIEATDGLWHGHIAMEPSGHVTYKRLPMENHGKENFTDKHDMALNDLASQKHGSNWGPVTYGWVDDGTDLYSVTFQEGEPGLPFEGHTLIADGFVPEDEFAAPKKHNHNHYGENIYPNQEGKVEGRVEDPEHGGNRRKYHGPGR